MGTLIITYTYSKWWGINMYLQINKQTESKYI
jgi:hypothetical protein